MIAPPEHIVVGPFAYTVVVDKAAIVQKAWDQRQRLLGECDPQLLEITINPDSAALVQRETFVHEILHAVFDQVGVTDDLGAEETEKAVNRSAPLLLDVLRRNPDLVTYLTQGVDPLPGPKRRPLSRVARTRYGSGTFRKDVR